MQHEIGNLILGIMNVSEEAVLGVLGPIMLAIAKGGVAAYLNLMALTATSCIIETQILKAGNHLRDLEPKDEKCMPPKGTSAGIVSNGMEGTMTVSMMIYLICSRINTKWYVYLLVSIYPLYLSNS